MDRSRRIQIVGVTALLGLILLTLNGQTPPPPPAELAGFRRENKPPRLAPVVTRTATPLGGPADLDPHSPSCPLSGDPPPWGNLNVLQVFHGTQLIGEAVVGGVPGSPDWQAMLEPRAARLAEKGETLRLVHAGMVDLEARIGAHGCEVESLKFDPPRVCELDPILVAVFAEDPTFGVLADPGIAPLPARIQGGHLEIWPPTQTGEARLYSPELPPIGLRWSKTDCDPVEAPGLARVTGRVMDPLDQGGPYFVEGCGGRALAEADGAYSLWIAAAEPCALEAWRLDGQLRALSEPGAIEPRQGAEFVIDLVLPEQRMAGLGLSFRIVDGGIEVLQIHEGTPAWEAGLRVGDLVTHVDGEPTSGMSENDFVAFATGPVGSEVALTLSSDEPQEIIRLRRQNLDGLIP